MAFISLALSALSTPGSASPDFAPVTGFQLDRYLGTWYEIARMPSSFEKDLVNVTATYELRQAGKVSVLNQGYKKTRDGKKSVAHGKAKFADSTNVGHLRVSFFGPFYADYIIVALDTASYRYAMVVSSSYKYLWILSRTSKIDPPILDQLIAKAKELGFATQNLFMVPQD